LNLIFRQPLNLPHDNTLKQLKNMQSELGNSHIISGSSMRELNSILKSYDLSASIQDGELNFIQKGEAIFQEAVILDGSILFSTPEFGSNGAISLRVPIVAGLNPGRQVYVNSQALTGYLTIQSVRFTGDNFGGEWEAEIEALTV
jgi:hypothetical protein